MSTRLQFFKKLRMRKNERKRGRRKEGRKGGKIILLASFYNGSTKVLEG